MWYVVKRTTATSTTYYYNYYYNYYYYYYFIQSILLLRRIRVRSAWATISSKNRFCADAAPRRHGGTRRDDAWSALALASWTDREYSLGVPRVRGYR